MSKVYAPFIVLLLWTSFTQAQITPTTFTNMPVVCTEQKDLTGQPLSACSYANQKFLRATQASWVRYCSSSTGCANPVWKRFDQVLDPGYVEVCTVAKTPNDPISGGSCKVGTGGTWSGMKYVAKNVVSIVPPAPPTATFEVTPAEGISPLEVTVAWNIQGLTGTTPCIAEGHPSWSGAKTAAGQEKFTVYADAAFTLTCADVDTRNVILQWTPPTTNSDGSVLTNLDYYTIHYGNSYVEQKPALSNTIMVDAPASTYIISNLKPGTWMFAMRSHNSVGAESDLSSVVNYTTTATGPSPVPRYSETKYVKVTVTPSPPSGLGVVEPKAYSLHQAPDQLTVQEFGEVPIGTQCDPQQAAMGLFLVKRAEATPDEGKEVPPVVLAKCEYDKKAKTTMWKADQPIEK